MSGTDDIKSLTDCGCCETPDLTYPGHFNRPGLDALAYRLATHSGFLERMLARLTRDQLPDVPLDKRRPLAALTTRDTTDPSIALLDAWAMVADVLAFYQERIANEAFLRTAGERRSVLELARAIGYELKPGVAASTVLAFTADGSKDSPPQVTVPRGTRVLSIPAKDELPQTFETIEEIVVRPEWNALKPYTPTLVLLDPIAYGARQLRLKGTATGLRPGDGLLIVGDERLKKRGDEHWDFRILVRVQAIPEKACTLVNWELGLGHQHPPAVGPAKSNPRLYAFRQRAALFGHNAPEWDTLDPNMKLRYAPRAIDAISSAAFSPNGAQALCSSVDGNLRVWSRTSKKPLTVWTAHAGSANAAVYTPDSRYVISAGDDGAVRVWDSTTGHEVHTFTGHQGPVLSVACGQYQYDATKIDGTPEVRTKIIAISGGADTTIRVWDVELLTAMSGSASLASAVNSVALYSSGKGTSLVRRVVCGGDDGSVRLWDVAGASAPLFGSAGQLLGTHSGAVRAVAMATNGTRIASGGADGKTKTWKRTTAWTSHREWISGNQDAITAVTFSADANQVLAGTADGDLRLYAWEAGGFTRPSTVHTGPVTALAWAVTGAVPVLTGGADRKLYLRTSTLNISDILVNTKLEDIGDWPDFDLKVNVNQPRIDLDSLYPTIVANSWVVLARTGYTEAYRVTEVDMRFATDFSLAAKVTRLELDTPEHLSWFGRRNTVIYAQSEPLELYADQQPDRTPLHGRAIVLSGLAPGLERGRRVVVAGQRMRARFRDARGSVLTSTDGYSQVDLAAGDLLVCLAPPYPDRNDYVVSAWRSEDDGQIAVVTGPASNSASADGLTLRWHLRDRNGFEGYVSTTLDEVENGVYEDTQMLVLRPPDKDANKINEVAVIERVIEVQRVRSRLDFTAELENFYDCETLTISANVAAATHGETTEREVLGSGDGTLTNQRFTLRKPPLTYVSASTASGSESSLEVRVNNVLWQEAPSLHELGARDQSYLVRHDNEHKTTIIFGDGVHATRLPTGQENITATYRQGIGMQGEVAVGALKLLQTKPLGIREVINPVAASGAAEPESLSEARANAPVTVLTLERVVSLKDYEDFTSAFAGIGKAQASALWTGTTQVVHITAATAAGQPLDRGSATYANLSAALAALRDQSVPVRVQGFGLLHFELSAQLRFDPRYLREQVEQQVRVALTAAFSFERRAFGQSVTHAEVITVIQSVDGVMAVTLIQFGFVDGQPNASSADVGATAQTVIPDLLPARRATWDALLSTSRPAQLLLLYPTTDGVKLAEMPP